MYIPLYVYMVSIHQATKQMNIFLYLFGMIVRVKVVFRKTVVGDGRFDYLSSSHLQSEDDYEDDDDT